MSTPQMPLPNDSTSAQTPSAAPSTTNRWMGYKSITLEKRWLKICAAFFLIWTTICIVVIWPYRPLRDEFEFGQEVQLLLDVQSVLHRISGTTPTMDSIRDVVFGEKLYGEALLKKGREIVEGHMQKEPLTDAATDEEKKRRGQENEFINVLQNGMQRWEDAKSGWHKDVAIFYTVWALLCIGPTIVFFILGSEGYRRWNSKMSARQQRLREGAKRRREMMAERAKHRPTPKGKKT